MNIKCVPYSYLIISVICWRASSPGSTQFIRSPETRSGWAGHTPLSVECHWWRTPGPPPQGPGQTPCRSMWQVDLADARGSPACSPDQKRRSTGRITFLHQTSPQQTHLSHGGQLGLVQEVVQSHEVVSWLHLCALASCHVTAAATLTTVHGAAAASIGPIPLFTSETTHRSKKATRGRRWPHRHTFSVVQCLIWTSATNPVTISVMTKRLYFFVVFCSVVFLYCVVFCCTQLYFVGFLKYFDVFCCSMLYYAVFWCIMLYCAVCWCILLYCVVGCCIAHIFYVLCCILL